MIKLLQLKTESNQRDYRTSNLTIGTTLISDHIVKSTTVRTTLKQGIRATPGKQDSGTGPTQ